MVTTRVRPPKTLNTIPQPSPTACTSLALPQKLEILGSWVADMAWAWRVVGSCSHINSLAVRVVLAETARHKDSLVLGSSILAWRR
jgi:hypothetical protein